MISLLQRGGPRVTMGFALVLTIWIMSGSTAMAQYSGGGGGGMGGYGYNPGFNNLGYGGSPTVYGGSGFPFYGDGTSYGYGLSYGHPTTFSNMGFLAPVMRHRKIRTIHRIAGK